MSANEEQLADPLIGRVLADQYRVMRSIGEGGIGRVYLAEHLGTARIVALKVLLPELAGNVELVDTFLEEARTVSRLGHENIIDIYYGGRSPDGLAFLVMEHLRGMDLADAFRLGGPMPWERARLIFMQVARALAAVHGHGLVHGDIKPGNIFLVSDHGRRDFVKLLDFGVAKAVGLGGDDERIAILGTPQYIAPEQAMGRPVDARADIYSLGCVIYRAVTDLVPFSADTPIELMAKHGYEAPIPPRWRRPDLQLPPQLDALVLKAMEKDPDRRFQSMAEMGEAIARCRLTTGGMAVAPSQSSQFKVDESLLRRQRARRRLRLAAMAAGLVLLGLGVRQVARELEPARLQIDVSPPTALIQVDRRLAPSRASATVAVRRGRHVVTASLPGYVRQSQEIDVGPGETRALWFALEVSPETGIEFTSEPPGAHIFVDGRPLEASPGVPAVTAFRATRIKPGWHKVELRSPTGVWQGGVEVKPDLLTPVHGVLPRPKPPKLIVRARRTMALVE